MDIDYLFIGMQIGIVIFLLFMMLSMLRNILLGLKTRGNPVGKKNFKEENETIKSRLGNGNWKRILIPALTMGLIILVINFLSILT